MADSLPPLPALTLQADQLIALGVPPLLGTTDDAVATAAQELATARPAATSDSQANLPVSQLLVPAASSIDYSALMALVQRDNKPGFVVSDMTDIADFLPLPDLAVPATHAYLLQDLQRGDEFQNDSPAEALAVIEQAGRTPITMLEGILWLLQQPAALSRNHCFMTIASRKPKPVKGTKSPAGKTPRHRSWRVNYCLRAVTR